MSNNSSHHPDNENEFTTTDALRQLTQAPRSQTIVTSHEFSSDEVHSARPTWTKPLPKLMLVAIALCPVFAVAWSVFNGFGKHPQQANLPKQESPVAQSPLSAEEMERLQQENAQLKAGRALDDQAKVEAQLRQNQEQKRSEVKTHTNPPTHSGSKTTPAPARPVAASSPVGYAPSPPRIQTAPVLPPRTATISRPTPTPARPVDPIQQWEALAQLGSYGSIRPDESLRAEFSNSAQSSLSAYQRARQAMQDAPVMVSSLGVPTAQIAPTSAIQSLRSSEYPAENPTPRRRRSELQPESIEEATDPSQLPSDNQADIEEQPPEAWAELLSRPSPPILEQAEAMILEGTSEQQALIAGETSSGVLVTPLVLTEDRNPDRFTVSLSEPMKDSRGLVVFPAGAELLVQVDSVSETGQIRLSAIAVTWEVNGYTNEMTLPADVVQIRGEDGDPLIAEHFEDRGGSIAGMDAGQFLLGAIGRAAELYTRSEASVRVGDSSTIITEDNPAPNIVAGLIEGGTDAVLESIQERNQRAIERMEDSPNVRFVEAGTPVEIFVNQSMFIPM